jgi:hypothetical protein
MVLRAITDPWTRTTHAFVANSSTVQLTLTSYLEDLSTATQAAALFAEKLVPRPSVTRRHMPWSTHECERPSSLSSFVQPPLSKELCCLECGLRPLAGFFRWWAPPHLS